MLQPLLRPLKSHLRHPSNARRRTYRTRSFVFISLEKALEGVLISLCFPLSANDHQLDWSFNHPLELTLMNYKNKADSITATLIPNLFPSFQRPDYEFYIASGFPEFVPVRVLMDDCFTQDDTITLQCKVLNAMQLL